MSDKPLNPEGYFEDEEHLPVGIMADHDGKVYFSYVPESPDAMKDKNLLNEGLSTRYLPSHIERWNAGFEAVIRLADMGEILKESRKQLLDYIYKGDDSFAERAEIYLIHRSDFNNAVNFLVELNLNIPEGVIINEMGYDKIMKGRKSSRAVEKVLNSIAVILAEELLSTRSNKGEA